MRGTRRWDGGCGEAGVAELMQLGTELDAVVLKHLQRLGHAEQLGEGQHSRVCAIGYLLADGEGSCIDDDALVQELDERHLCTSELSAEGSLQESEKGLVLLILLRHAL